MKNNKGLIIGMIGLIILMIGGTYAYYKWSSTSNICLLYTSDAADE